MGVIEHIAAEYLYLITWSFIGSILGYFAFANITKDHPKARIKACLLSIAIGMFISLPIFTYLIEQHTLSPRLSIMLSGLGAFGLPDFIMKHYQHILTTFVYRFTKHKADKYSRDSYD